MTVAFYTNIVSPHQMPLAREVARIVGETNFRYVCSEPFHAERSGLGWKNETEQWILEEGDGSGEAPRWLEECEVLVCGNRAVDLWERRARAGRLTIYFAERWFKPVPVRILGKRLQIPGVVRLLIPRYFKMARRTAALLGGDGRFVYFSSGIHAARDMVRIRDFFSGRPLRSLFAAPRVCTGRNPGGEVSRERGGAPVANIRIWGYFVEPGGCRGKRNPSAEASGCRMLWVGRFLDWKHVDDIVRAVAMLAGRGKDVSLDIYGTGPEETRLRKLADKIAPGCVRIHPPVPISDVRRLMREHDVYVLSSDGFEGWGAVVNEALEEGMSVVGTRDAGASATVLPGERLYRAGDAKALARLIAMAADGALPPAEIGEWTVERAALRLVEFARSRGAK